MLAHLPWVWDWTAGGWAAIAAWGTLGVAAVAALFARHQVLEARRTREDQAQPFVVVDFEPSKAGRVFVDLIIRNTGTTVATNVKVVFDPPLVSTMTETDGKYRLRDAAIITKGVPTLPPSREYRMLFEQMPNRYASDLPRSYDAVVSFDDTRGRRHEMKYRLDLDIYFGFTHLEVYGEHDAAKALKEIEKTLGKWSHIGNGLTVWTRDEDARLARQQSEWEEQLGRHAEVENGDREDG